MDRRDFLRGAARAGVVVGGALSPLGRLLGQTAVNHAGRIDVHHHYVPPFREGPSWSWSPATALADMDRHDVATAILSGVSFPEPLNDGTAAHAISPAGRTSTSPASLRSHPGRFGLFAAIPLADNDGSLAEIEYAFDTLQADGVTIQSSAARTWPGEPARCRCSKSSTGAARRCSCTRIPRRFAASIPRACRTNVSEFDNDVNRAVLSLLWNGVLTHYPDINFIVAHTGGTVPALAGRIQDRVPEDRPDLFPHGALDKLRRLYLELGHASFPWVVRAALEFSGPSRLLFGTDYPVEPHEVTTRHIPALGLAPEVLYAIDRGNAERLFPRHRA